VKNVDLTPVREAKKVLALHEVAVEQQLRPTREWSTSVAPWDTIVEAGRSLFGDQCSFNLMATIAAGLRCRKERCDSDGDLLDARSPLCRRVRHARLRAGNRKWWARTLERADTDSNRGLACLVFWTWAGPTTLVQLLDMGDALLARLGADEWQRFFHCLKPALACERGAGREEVALARKALPTKLSPRGVLALSNRVRVSDRLEIWSEYLGDYDGDDPAILDLCWRSALAHVDASREDWPRYLEVVANTYGKWAQSVHHTATAAAVMSAQAELPPQAIAEIAEHPLRYPPELLHLADSAERQRLASIMEPVAEVAERDAWFLD